MKETSFITTDEVPLESSRIKKGRYLELAVRRALEELKVSFKDTSRIYNGKLIGFVPLGRELANGKVPDFFVDYFLLESKNWSLSKYHVGLSKAKTEINSRAINFPFHKRVLIISKDRFTKRAREYLKNEGWTIITLGFVVNRENLSEAVFKLKYYFKKLFRICDKRKVNRVCHEYYSYSNAHCSNASMVNEDYMMRGASLILPKGDDIVPLAENKLNRSSNSKQLKRERDREEEGSAKGEGTSVPLSTLKELHSRDSECLSIPSTQKINLSYRRTYPIRAEDFLTSMNLHDNLLSVVGKFQLVLSLVVRFVLGIFGMLKTRVVKGYGSVGVKLVNRLRSKLSNKLSKLFMYQRIHSIMVKGNEEEEESYQPTIRRRSNRESKELRYQHLTYNKQPTKDLSRASRTITEGSRERRTMKIRCPVCGIEGYLEVRGNSYRVKHYQGYINGKRKYIIHSISREQAINLGINGNKYMGIKNLNSSLNLVNESGRSLAWSRTSACHAEDPGSNPGGRTKR